VALQHGPPQRPAVAQEPDDRAGLADVGEALPDQRAERAVDRDDRRLLFRPAGERGQEVLGERVGSLVTAD